MNKAATYDAKWKPWQVFSIPTIASLTILLLLTLSAFFCTQYPPIRLTDVEHYTIWYFDLSRDEFYNQRLQFIIIGVISSGLALIVYALSWISKQSWSLALLNTLLLFFNIRMGLFNYPYWANGMHQVFNVFPRSGDYDPKGLLPQIFFSQETQFTFISYLLLFWLACFLLFVFLVIRQLVAVFRKKIGTAENIAISVLLLGVVLMENFTPGILGWYLD